MYLLYSAILLMVFLYSLLAIAVGYENLYRKKNPFGLTPYFTLLGVFVWADSIVFGVFFALSSLICLVLANFTLFLLVYSVFWVIRSIGEQIYWFLEQFAQDHRNLPASLKMSKFYKGESIYIHYQILWQCVSVIAIISSVYFFYQLLST